METLLALISALMLMVILVMRLLHLELELLASKQKLIKITWSLLAGIKQATKGNRIGDISNAIQLLAERNNYSVVKEYVGHGVGLMVHEEPQIPNYGNEEQISFRKRNGSSYRADVKSKGMKLPLKRWVDS